MKNKMYLIVIEFAKWLSNTKGFVKSTIEGYLRSVMLLDEYIKNLTLRERGVESYYRAWRYRRILLRCRE